MFYREFKKEGDSNLRQYKHFISLGYFCSVAMELERIGLRNESSPFDWCISNYEGVISLIENHFKNFLEVNYLVQDEVTHKYYFNEKYNIWFFHDFDEFHSLEKQLPNVKKKYLRRIERFYQNIKEPTLFVRYISGGGDGCNKSAELEYIERNNQHIIALLKSFNKENDVVYIANEGVVSNSIKIYNIKRDEGDGVARRFLEKNDELNTFFESFDYELRKKNIKFFKQKQRKKNNIILKIYKKVNLYFKRKNLSVYVHNRVTKLGK